ncbi:MAG: zf-HC2 domain-containing protein [Bacillota bacterium]
MRECPMIQDLLPLYVDDAISPESRELIDQHLATCPGCRSALAALKRAGPPLAVPPSDAGPSEDARFLTRLKRRMGTAIGLALTAMLLVAFLANQYGQSQAGREYGRLMESRREAERAAFAAMAKASPDPMARLKEHGVTLTHSATRSGTELQVDYQLTPRGPADQVSHLAMAGDPDPRLFDPATGKELGRPRRHGSSWQPGQPTSGHIRFEGVEALPPGAMVQLPYLLVHHTPAEPLTWQVERPGEEGDVPIGQRVTVAGVEFEVERVRFARGAVQVDYRQVTDPARVGLYLLDLRLSDRMGGSWGSGPGGDTLPDPHRPSQRFDFVASLSRHWIIEVEAALLALPGPTIAVEVK